MRALTRDPGSAKARDLPDAGAEVVAADLDDEAALRAAFDGVHAVYLVTNYWADMSAEHGIAEAANGARAAKAAGVQHLIWSTLEDTRAYLPLDDPSTPVFDGKYTVPHIGRTALGILKRGDQFTGRTVGVAGEHLTGEQFAAAFAESYGEPVAYRPLTFDEFRAQDFPTAGEIGNTFQYYYEAGAEFTGSRDIALVRTLNPQLQTFRSWLRTHPVPAR